jgi:hypothetical protein
LAPKILFLVLISLGYFFSNGKISPNPDTLLRNDFPSATFRRRRAGLSDGLFSNQKYQFGSILEGLKMENGYIFHGHLEYFMDILDIL